MTPVVLDVRAVLPFEDNIYGTFSPKDSLTFHWNGPPVDRAADPLEILKADAEFHLNKGWGGISYHKAIWIDGTLYLTRDDDAVLAACGNAVGNARSTHVQVMVGVGQSPTLAQWWRMAELARVEKQVHPHKFWSNTSCPGFEIESWVNNRAWEENLNAEETKTIAEKVLADAGLDPATVGVIKHKLDDHIHALIPNANQTTVPLFPPVKGALYGGGSVDFSEVFWDYPDGTRHTWLNGKEVT